MSSIPLFSHIQDADDDNDDDDANDQRSSAQHLFSLDPDSVQAQDLIVKDLGLSVDIYEKLAELSHVVTELNQQVNLVSRKDCTPSTIFGRHVLPCVAACALSTADNNSSNDKKKKNPLETAQNVVDVGTGGGFPGLVLAVLYPSTDFLLLDSVGKKLTAVQDAANRLGLDNVKTHHGRAEDFEERFDVATGRSVAAIPQFCAWMQHLLHDKGHLLYWIGGDIPADVLDLVERDEPVGDLVPALGSSDKRILVFPASAVKKIAKESGLLRARKSLTSRKKKKSISQKSSTAKGSWSKKDRDAPKQRGYENFKRISFTPSEDDS